ncbi:hypothetical protein ACQ4WX_46545 [Streptomyces lasalocidi]
MRLVHELTKARALAALRHDAGLPRSAFVRGASRAKPVPVDFAALPTLHLLERICAHQPGPELLVEETLHAPGRLRPGRRGTRRARRRRTERRPTRPRNARPTRPGLLRGGPTPNPSLKEDGNAPNRRTHRPRRPHR